MMTRHDGHVVNAAREYGYSTAAGGKAPPRAPPRPRQKARPETMMAPARASGGTNSCDDASAIRAHASRANHAYAQSVRRRQFSAHKNTRGRVVDFFQECGIPLVAQ